MKYFIVKYVISVQLYTIWKHKESLKGKKTINKTLINFIFYSCTEKTTTFMDEIIIFLPISKINENTKFSFTKLLAMLQSRSYYYILL